MIAHASPAHEAPAVLRPMNSGPGELSHGQPIQGSAKLRTNRISAVHELRSRALALIDVRGRAIAIGMTTCALALMMALVVLGKVHSVPYGVYAAAGARWLLSQELYETQTIDGFQYLPTSAWLFSWFARLGEPLAAWTWRVLSSTLYATGLWRVAKRLLPARARACFLIATCMTLGPVGNNSMVRRTSCSRR